jgi:hypothetical protein
MKQQKFTGGWKTAGQISSLTIKQNVAGNAIGVATRLELWGY